MRRPVLKELFEAGNSIPVERAQDHAKKGIGKIRFETETRVVGIGTRFKEQFTAGDSISIPNVPGQQEIQDQIIQEILSDTEIDLKQPGVQLEVVVSNEEFDFKVLPKFDQSLVFREVENVLGKGGCVAMFPEGGSHDNSDLLPFKAGIALMTFGTILKTG